MKTDADGWSTGCRGAENVHTKFFGIFALDISPTASGWRADVRFKNQESPGMCVGHYFRLDFAKAQAPSDMRAQVLVSLAEVTS